MTDVATKKRRRASKAQQQSLLVVNQAKMDKVLAGAVEEGGSSPEQTRRLALSLSMNAKLREVAFLIREKLLEKNYNDVMLHYEVGELVADVEDNPDLFGANALELLAAFLDMPGGTVFLSRCAKFARAFEREDVEKYSKEPTSGGRMLTATHWLLLSDIKEADKRRSMLESIIERGWSTTDLRLYMKVYSLPSPEDAVSQEDSDDEVVPAFSEVTVSDKPRKNKLEATPKAKGRRGRSVAVPADPLMGMQKCLSYFERGLKYLTILEGVLEKFEADSELTPEQEEILELKIKELYANMTAFNDNMENLLPRVYTLYSNVYGAVTDSDE